MLLKELELPKAQQKLSEACFIEMERSLKTGAGIGFRRTRIALIGSEMSRCEVQGRYDSCCNRLSPTLEDRYRSQAPRRP